MEEIEKAIAIAKRELPKSFLDRVTGIDCDTTERNAVFFFAEKYGTQMIDIKKQTSTLIQ